VVVEVQIDGLRWGAMLHLLQQGQVPAQHPASRALGAIGLEYPEVAVLAQAEAAGKPPGRRPARPGLHDHRVEALVLAFLQL